MGAIYSFLNKGIISQCQVFVLLSCKPNSPLYSSSAQERAHIAFCENCLDIFCADHIIVCSHGLLHTSALKNFADQPGVGEVLIFITNDLLCRLPQLFFCLDTQLIIFRFRIFTIDLNQLLSLIINRFCINLFKSHKVGRSAATN